MDETQRTGVQRQACDGAVTGAVFAVANDGVPEVFHVHAYLVFATGVEFQLDECVSATACQHLVAGDGKLTFFGVVNRVDLKLRVLGKIAAHHAFGLALEFAFKHRHIFAVEYHVAPVVLQVVLGNAALGKQHQSRGVAVEAVYDKHLRLGVVGLHIFAHLAVHGAFLHAVGAHRQHTVALVDNEQVVVLIHQLDARVLEHGKCAVEVD